MSQFAKTETKTRLQSEEALLENDRIIGSRQAPYDALLKITGRSKYGEDIYLPNLIYGKILRAEYAHAKITKIDTSDAEKIPGVRAVITRKDFLPIGLESEIADQTQAILANERVLYYGQPVCVVAADTIEIAERALE